ncbi:MAG TPA: branched-chain amino acid ABC transporter substrate-binding protein [Actinocrinis sp.]|jgi:branched-chain amino acid transport system substrate-binding protein|uniref:branched-chain amino acid ABC transporter substrate-binding protein n=1 Tax=Actinocrinis sp. TaxID=1920516 RepID=UPI002DDCE21C|nr:branched-chain amino acid ABC transporter substrate-binding protein [Actinocrinis sp.]HEV3169459.1 branched-chain amino acid ABC transporter substrate-binding protein [Actinocrinis sp.]
MRSTSLYKVGAVVVVGALTLAGCGSRGGSNNSSSSSNTTVDIGVDAPLTGSLAALGLGIKNSVDLAVNTANKNNEVPGVTFKLVAKDDQANPTIGQQNATALVADSALVGVVGPLNSSVAQSMQQIFDQANVTEVSPANTNPSLTQGPNWQTNKARPYKSYFRVVTTDAIQGPFAADYVYNTLGIKKVATVNDGKTYGAGLAMTFTQEFQKLGGTITVAQTVSDTSTDFSAVVNAVKTSGAQLLYYGGEYPVGGPLSKQLKAAGDNIPEMGGDGNQDPTYIQLAGVAAANGDYATVPGAPLATLASAKTFIANYDAAHYGQPYAVYGGYSYDSAWAIIEAVKAVVSANGGKVPSSSSDFRSKVEAAEQNVSFSGVTGQVSFDQYGDTGNKELTMYKVENGAWDNGVKVGTFNG